MARHIKGSRMGFLGSKSGQAIFYYSRRDRGIVTDQPMNTPSKAALMAANQINYSWGIGDYDENKSMPEAVAGEIQKACDQCSAPFQTALKSILALAQQ